jgi:hypothetical protein
LTQTKWSTPTLKAHWFDDEGIAPVDPAAEATRNTLKVGSADVAIDGLSVQAFFDRLASDRDEPATG